jgi:D-amino-acid dehydrogenase
MRVVVMGAGVVGVTAAHELRRDGHDVVVVERLDEPAGETSFANAGLVAPGHAYAWASPRAPKILLKSLFDDRQALRFRPSFDPALWAWSWRFLMNCSAERARENTSRKARLCRYSQRRLHVIAEETGIDFHRLTGGLLYLYRDPETLARGSGAIRILIDAGLDLRLLDADGAVALDPSLRSAKEKLAGAIFCPSDESGDARVFTQELAKHDAAQGVEYRFGSEILGFESEGSRILALMTSKGRIEGDRFVMCLGVFASRLARDIGVSLPVYPIKGYSVTLPISAGNEPPTLGGVDEDRLIAYARFADRLRATATAEFAGYDKSHKPADFAHMLASLRELYPNGADFSQPQYWAGLRPMTPEGTPIFGRGRHENLFFNAGHGHMGWTMAAGSARISADLLSGRAPAIPLDGMLLGEGKLGGV